LKNIYFLQLFSFKNKTTVQLAFYTLKEALLLTSYLLTAKRTQKILSLGKVTVENTSQFLQS
jgi:hypothetical protein